MATRAELKAQLRAMLGLASDDPLASDAVLNPILNQAYQGLVADVAWLAPDALLLTDSVALTARVGTLPTPLVQVRQVRETDADGALLNRAPYDELALLSGAYAVTGAAEPYTITVTDDVAVGTLWVAYTTGAGANDLSAETTVPALLPTTYHDVIALEAAWAMSLGGEQRLPPEVHERREDRKAMLFHALRQVGGGGPASRTRMVVGQP